MDKPGRLPLILHHSLLGQTTHYWKWISDMTWSSPMYIINIIQFVLDHPVEASHTFFFGHYSIFIVVISFIYSYSTYLLSTYCLQRISLVILWDTGNEKNLTLKDGADVSQVHRPHCSAKINMVTSV